VGGEGDGFTVEFFNPTKKKEISPTAKKYLEQERVNEIKSSYST
jgi:hypothetical protein